MLGKRNFKVIIHEPILILWKIDTPSTLPLHILNYSEKCLLLRESSPLLVLARVRQLRTTLEGFPSQPPSHSISEASGTAEAEIEANA